MNEYQVGTVVDGYKVHALAVPLHPLDDDSDVDTIIALLELVDFSDEFGDESHPDAGQYARFYVAYLEDGGINGDMIYTSEDTLSEAFKDFADRVAR